MCRNLIPVRWMASGPAASLLLAAIVACGCDSGDTRDDPSYPPQAKEEKKADPGPPPSELETAAGRFHALEEEVENLKAKIVYLKGELAEAEANEPKARQALIDYNAKHPKSEDVVFTFEDGRKMYRLNEEREDLYKKAVDAPRAVANLKGDLAGAEFRLTLKTKDLAEARQAVSAARAHQQAADAARAQQHAAEAARHSVPAVHPPTGGPGHVH